MPHLSLSFLGGFEVTLDAQALTSFSTAKTRALLAYLAIEAHRPHRRAHLAAMFWPEASEKNAAHNLNQTLLRLRQALRQQPGEPKAASQTAFLQVSPQEIQFNAFSDSQVDVVRFRALLNMAGRHRHTEAETCEACQQWLFQAAELYRGDLLTGLFVPDSVAFEEWRVVQQEDLHGQALEALRRLATGFERRGEHERVQDFARRLIALEPWNEDAQLQLMRALAMCGQTSAALKQFETYARTLDEELGLEPSPEARRLYEQIRSGEALSRPAAQPGGEPIWLASQGERRQVTVLACGRILEGGPDDLSEPLAPCEQVCEKIYPRFGGRRALRQGETCLVYFGYPQAYEDAPQRAVHAGLEAMQAAAGRGVSLGVGIHTGMVVVGETRGRRWSDRDLAGPALELARDGRRLAAAGEVLVSEPTRRLVQAAFEMDSTAVCLPAHAGTAAAFYRVHGESGLPGRLEWLAHTHRLTEYVGRATELTHLHAILERARAGKGHALLMRGEPGIGKSRLAWELKKLALPDDGASPLQWVASRCLPYDQNTSLYPMIGLLEGLLGFEAGDGPAARLEKLNTLLGWYGLGQPSAVWLLALLLGLPTEPPAPETITTAQREQMRRLFVALAQKRAAEQPLVLMIDDLHWGDPSTVEWLGQSLAALASGACLVLLAARPGFNPPWLEEKALKSALSVLNLGPLSAEDAGMMLADLAGPARLDDETRRQIAAQADGVPLFIEELAKTLLEKPAGERSRRPEIPASLVDSLAARLDHLGAAKETAQWAAVIGREFFYPVLEASAPYDARRLQADLARLVEAGLVAPMQASAQDLRPLLSERSLPGLPERFTFKHTLVQEAVYASLLKRPRQEYHRQVAETLAGRFPQIAETRPEVLARHYSEAGLTAPAVDCWLRAGIRALAQGAVQEAGAFYDHALELAQASPAPDDGGLLLARCRLAMAKLDRMRGNYEIAIQRLEAARSVFLAVDDRALLCKTLIELGAVWARREDFAATQQSLNAGLSLARALDDQPEIARALTILGNAAYFQGEYPTARRFYEESLAIRRTLGDPWGIANSLGNLGVVLDAQGEVGAAQPIYLESLALRRSLGDKSGIANSLNNLGQAAYVRQDFASALACYAESLDLLRELGDKWGIAVALNNLGEVYCAQQEYAHAKAHFTESLKLAAEMGNKRARGYSLVGLGMVALGQHDFAEAQRCFLESLHLRQELGDKNALAESLTALAALRIQQHDPRGAARLFGAAHALMVSIGTPLAVNETTLAELQAALGADQFHAAWAEGETLTVEAVIGLA